MCSFLIYYLKNHTNLPSRILERLIARGPDALTTMSYRGYHFTHFLLHITGERTTQPFFHDESNSKVICVYNGEIYNYRDLFKGMNCDGSMWSSDGQCLLPLYLRYSNNFIGMLDGEFAICLYDFLNNIVVLSTDLFGTKPLWYAIVDGNICTSTYESALVSLDATAMRVPPNCCMIFELSTGKLLKTQSVYEFDLRQHKDHYNDWITAFDRAMLKRTCGLTTKPFITISSGYDSGCINCALLQHQVQHKTYTMVATETLQTLVERALLNRGNFELITINKDEIKEIREYLKQRSERVVDPIVKMAHFTFTGHDLVMDNPNKICIPNHGLKLNAKLQIKHVNVTNRSGSYQVCEDQFPFPSGVYYVDKLFGNDKFSLLTRQRQPVIFQPYSVDCQSVIIVLGKVLNHVAEFEQSYSPHSDNASIGLYKIFQHANISGHKVYLSGQGGDEIYSDYGFQGDRFKCCSMFGGLFPQQLEGFFPWKNFYGSTQRAFLDKEEILCGMHGIESRYPFLDREVVQEFLWLTSELKNCYYKAPIHQYMAKYQYPFDVGKKIGFQACRNVNSYKQFKILLRTLEMQEEKEDCTSLTENPTGVSRHESDFENPASSS